MAQLSRKVALALLILPALSGCDFVESFFDSELVTACEAALKFRLPSPSGYKRIKISHSEDMVMDRAGYAEYLSSAFKDADYREKLLQDFDRGSVKPVLFSMVISYDAPNAFGTPLRAHSQCEYVDEWGDETKANEILVMIDGQDNADWLNN
ncbi:hypothetical protein [Sinorhizobium sp. CCBAU 05631]|uniref:hypothetical protein n=1 Tax=Sinorhizobium sp. CCBAU 05631 TaxID=794846 RepID=UPI0005604B0B|nr:hypothetical protein [Sinorhizobium sp. CCBAU 05631]